MELFAAAGIDLPRSGTGRRAAGQLARTLRIPLLNYKVVQLAAGQAAFAPSPVQLAAAQDYARKVRSAKFLKEKETAVRPVFIKQILEEVLGYRTVDPDATYSIAFEKQIRRGSVDVAIGRFGDADAADIIVAPFELKGPGTDDLDRIMPGRGRSPVQQAWDYAVDAPGSRWVLVSNCVELRLYGFGRGRDAYERFDLSLLDDEREHERLWLILSAERFLGGATDKLLRDTDSAYKDITNDLYKDYKGLRDDLIAFLVDSSEGPRQAYLAAIETAQKVLDRILFIAFAERTDLLPDKLLDRASRTQNAFVPQPIWMNFLALFRAVDRGNDRLSIDAYNGGLFAEDEVADSLILPDDLAIKVAGLGNWDYRNEVPVTVLGHIFEQSITDIEQKKARLLGQPEPEVSKRKRDGVVYTPDMVTRFLVERTIGLTLSERLAALHLIHDIRSEDGERALWLAYLDVLRNLTVVDPACGSGAFLVAAFDELAREYRAVTGRLADLGETIDFDPFDEIVTKNLHGVDLNAESVEITRLSLWLKTARRQHKLQNLENTIRTGNSLIDDPAFTPRPFDWRAAFPQVFANGGFDVVLGNPPYVRMEFIKPFKPYLEKNYVVAADRADLYAYFFEKGVGLLKEGGRIGYISSSTFFRTGSGENLRIFLKDRVAIESVVDFGDLQLFEGVTTYPAILTALKGPVEEGSDLQFLNVKDQLPENLGSLFTDAARPMPHARLGAGSWQFEGDALAALRDKIGHGKRTLGEVYGAPLYGIKTGLNEAFIIDTPTRDRLVKADPKSADLLKPFLRGEDVRRWRVEPQGLWLINTPRGKVDIDTYPAIRDWLLPFRPELEKRATKQEWFELQQAQLAYQPKFEKIKIVYLDIAKNAPFSVDLSGDYIDCTIFMIEKADDWVLAYLNSKTAWFQWVGQTPIASGGYIRLKAQYISLTVMPKISNSSAKHLAALGQACTEAAQKRFALLAAVRRRILDLAPPERARLNGKLEDWHALDFSAFRAEVKRAFRAEIPLKARGEWEAYLTENRAAVLALTDQIASAEREIDTIVYGLFDLTPDEIALLESTLDRA
jgi:hypothetical protein